MEKNSLKIVPLKELLGLNLSIPSYQRPYRWTTESASLLFNDIYSAFKNHIQEYRIGSVVLFNNGNELEIVDGQQRVTTLSILIYCYSLIAETENNNYLNLSKLLSKENAFGELSHNAIIENFQVLKRLCEIVEKEEIKPFIKYSLENCTFVKIITETEQEAFQFFDSQNSRGKALAPQDLLKSYHLREMYDSSEDEKVKIINKWEDEKQKALALFFTNNLYPLVRWYNNKDGLNYSSKRIKVFKGIKQSSNYHYSIYHKAANLFIEHYNSEGLYELTQSEKINQFQLTQPIIAGKRFFQYSLYYFNLYKNIIKLIESKFASHIISSYGSGNSYIRNLFINIVIFYVDKFNMEELTDNRLKFLYNWAYSLRLVMHSVYPQTVNKYALGSWDCRVNPGLNLFMRISEMQNPQEIDSIIIEKVKVEETVKDKYSKPKYPDIWKFIFGGN